MKKKTITLILSALLILTFVAGCASRPADPAPAPTAAVEPTAELTPAPISEPTATPGPTPEPTPEPTSEPTPEPAAENALTEEELAEFNGMLATIVNMGKEDAYVSDVSCFFTSYYDDPRDLDLRYFLRYYPYSEPVTDETEFNEIKKLDNWPFPEAESLEKMPVPVHKMLREDIDATLTKYAGITTADLSGVGAEGVFYLEESDAYYNYTSDFGPGTFQALRGERDGEFVTLYNESGHGAAAVLRLELVDGRWLIRSYTLIET
ncbi:MAG: hypothetical protein K6F67_07245 [Oscillospiraceae bacterium]|nr:hypothetical protein [Oscillospiraceae bacterium]